MSVTASETGVKLTQERLKEVLDYDPETGVFRWKYTEGRAIRGAEAGTIASNGYRVISINNKKHKAHRLAWMFLYRNFPISQIDHINQDRADNRIHNLRSVSALENGRNQKIRTNNSSGFNGVTWNKRDNIWTSGIRINNVRKNLGSYVYKKDAISARERANIKYGFHKNHGK